MSHKNQPPYFNNKKNPLLQVEKRETHISASAGPIPSADELAKYEAVSPGITQILLSTYQRQVNHRIEIESSVVKQNNINSARGQTYAFIIVLVAMVAGFALIIFNKDVAGLSTIIFALAGLVGTFLYGRSQEKKERIEKAKQVPEIK
ncbi:MAG: DUF2335 domain-containing protein [Lachnospiraceae bacterium]|nr:DUF2335 domain-containing protein [Lachnospiraceae bacterium]